MNITQHFTWSDALRLPSWNVEHIPSASERENLLKLFNKLELVRAHLGGHSINVHCAIRPILNNPSSPFHGQDYNSKVGGAKASAHITGCAVDFDVSGMSCDEVRAKLLPKLEEFGLRMENNGVGSSWIHLDVMQPCPNRYFKP